MTAREKCSEKFIGLILALALFCLASTVSAATYYVSTTGSDGNDGLTPATAWQTITHAVATVPAGTAATPNVISAAAGTYDNTTNGETFPITFANAHVHLSGAGSASTFINAQDLADALHINATGVTISGFTFQNASDADAIVLTEGGFTITNNIFDSTVKDGISFYLSETDRTTSVSFADMAITDNTLRTTQNGIYVSVELDFDSTVQGLSATFGNLTITGNTLPLTSGDGIYISELFSTTDITNGSVTIGNFTATSNTVTGGDGGIFVYGSVYNMDNTQVTAGNLTVSNNTCTNQSSYGLYIDYWDLGYFSGTTNAVFGDFTVFGNTVTATDYSSYPSTDGIYIYDIDYMEYLYDDTTITTGNIEVTNNTVDVSQYAIYLYSYGIYYVGETAGGDAVSVSTGSRTISSNTINSNNTTGLYLDLEYIGYDMYGTSSVDYGGFTINHNTITSSSEALYFYWYECGIYMYEDSVVTLGAVTISDNTLVSSNSDAFEWYNYYGGYDMYWNSAVTYGPTSITNNTLTAGSGYGMYFEFSETPIYMYDMATFTMGNFTIDNNTITANGSDGIYINYDDYYTGSYMENDSTATLPSWSITDNTIDVTGGYHGVQFYTYSNPYDNYDNATVQYGNTLIDNNTFNPNKDAGMDYGIYFWIEDLVVGGYDNTITTLGKITITDNRLYNIVSEAIYLGFDEAAYSFDGTPTLTVGDIEVGNNIIDTAPYGIDAYFNDLSTNSMGKVNFGKVNIHDNTLTNISDTGISVFYSNSNSDPGMGATLTIGAPTIDGNTISGAPGSSNGIYLFADNATAGITFGTPFIFGNSVSGFSQGISLEALQAASLSCNFLEDNTQVGMRFNTAGTNLEVHSNSLVNNNVGLSVVDGMAAVIDAEKNWWGDPLGPVACASCNGVYPGDSGTVDYTPWLTSQPDITRCGGAFPWPLFLPAITGMGN